MTPSRPDGKNFSVNADGRYTVAAVLDRAYERNDLLKSGIAKVLFGIGFTQRPEFSACDGLGKGENVSAEEAVRTQSPHW